jgi:hypothetical protein
VIAGNLFTRDYLLEGITLSDSWTTLSDTAVAALKAGFLKRVESLRAISNANEAQTEKTLIYPILEILGWTDIEVQQTLSPKGRKQVPDALLFADSDSRDRSVAEPDQWRRFQNGLAVLEAKRWDRSLDRATKSDEGVPATQMLQYLSRVDIQTSGKVRFGILTNGRIWRLYWQGALSVADDFFEIDLGKALLLPGCELDLLDRVDDRITPERCLKLFILMFGKSAFLPLDGQRTFHEVSRDMGKTWEEKVTKDLSRLVFGELYPKIVSAIAANDPKHPSLVERSYLGLIRQSSLILLYRLLFVVYAEDRDLLPHNREPYKDFSLTAMRLDIAKRKADGKTFSETMVTYWPKLTAIFKAISEGDNSFGIPPYNGGLFAKESAPLLSDIHLPDSIITDVIYGLSHRLEDGEPRYINYRDLSVQQLGSVYEKTLEYDLAVSADGRVVPDADDTARHESGSYYTADSLVMLIIEKAVGPLVEERRAAFQTEVEKLATDSRSKDIRLAVLTAVDPAKAILGLKICDPAMGSGHFLVSLVDWLADKVLASMAEAEQAVTWADTAYQSPLATEISSIRHEIVRHAAENKWPYVDEHLQDRHIVRRMVLKRCVYGVDKNPLAVELAKVALWLHTFTVGAPLSFLDHHLRCGDSLFGAWVHPAMDRLVQWGSPLLMDAPLKRALGAASGMQTIERLTDADIAEVYQSKNLFDGIESMTSELTGLLTLVHTIEWQEPSTKLHKATLQEWTKGTFGDPVKVAIGAAPFDVPPPPIITELEKKKRSLQKTSSFNTHDTAATLKAWLPDIKAKFETEHFFHWQVAFPGIWRDWQSAELSGGFDAIIGNPPYVRQELIKSIKPGLKRAYPKTYDGSADLYVYFYDQGLRLLKPGGRLSYVVTNKWMRAGYAEGLRGIFSDESWVEFVADFGHAKKFFPEADVFPSVVVLRKPLPGPAPDDTLVCVIPREDVPEKALDEAVAKATYPLPRVHFTKQTWTLEPPDVARLMEKIRRSGQALTDYAGVKPYRGVLTGFNQAFLIDTATRDRLVSESGNAAEVIKPYVRGQDLIRWGAPWDQTWMIFARRGIELDLYPSVKRYLEKFRVQLEPKPDDWQPAGPDDEWQGRKPGNYRWYEIQDAVDFWQLLEQPKILYPDIAWTASFSIDTAGVFTNNTGYIIPTGDPWLAAVLNAPVGWWFAWRKAQHGKDEALRYFNTFVEGYPVPPRPAMDISSATSRLTQLTLDASARSRLLTQWLKHEWGINTLSRILQNPVSLDSDKFLSAVREVLPKKRKLTALEIAELTREHGTTIEPARQDRAEIFALETKLSDLVNQAYALTQSEIELIWHTAPPRMPFTPNGLTTGTLEGPAHNGSQVDTH